MKCLSFPYHPNGDVYIRYEYVVLAHVVPSSPIRLSLLLYSTLLYSLLFSSTLLYLALLVHIPFFPFPTLLIHQISQREYVILRSLILPHPT